MGFFQDLKEDLSQAVNELLPEEALENKEAEVTNESLKEAEDAELSELAALLEKMDEMEKTSDDNNEDLVETLNPEITSDEEKLIIAGVC